MRRRELLGWLVWTALLSAWQALAQSESSTDRVEAARKRVQSLFNEILWAIWEGNLHHAGGESYGSLSNLDILPELWKIEVSESKMVWAKIAREARVLEVTTPFATARENVLAWMLTYQLAHHYLPNENDTEKLRSLTDKIIARSSKLTRLVAGFNQKVLEIMPWEWGWDYFKQSEATLIFPPTECSQ